MNINIETNTVLNVTSDELDVIARELCGVKLSLADSGAPAYLVQSVSTNGVTALTSDGVHSDTQNALLNIGITVLAAITYLRILDPEVRRLLSTFFNGQEGLPINYTNVVNSSSTSFQTLFKNNTDIVNFDEFKYFSWYNANGYWSFDGCSNLQSIDISNVSVFPQLCFRNCNSLCYFNGSNSERGRLTLGSCLIPIECFRYCNGIESVEFLNSDISFANDNPFANCLNISKIYVKDINDYLNIPFRGAESNPLGAHGGVLYANGQVVTSVVYPETQTLVYPGQWCRNTALQSVVLPSSITSIGNSAFYYCSGLTSITIPNSVTSIGYGAFSYCGLLSFPNINSVTTLGDYVFGDNLGMSGEVNIPGTAVTIPNRFLNNVGRNSSGLTDINIQEGVTSIGTFFVKDSKVTGTITIPSTVLTIGYDFMLRCSGKPVVKFLGSTPPQPSGLYPYWYLGDYSSKVLVPQGSLQAYQTALSATLHDYDKIVFEEYTP